MRVVLKIYFGISFWRNWKPNSYFLECLSKWYLTSSSLAYRVYTLFSVFLWTDSFNMACHWLLLCNVILCVEDFLVDQFCMELTVWLCMKSLQLGARWMMMFMKGLFLPICLIVKQQPGRRFVILVLLGYLLEAKVDFW